MSMERETILYETNDFLVVKKPAGLASQGDGSADDLCSRLAALSGGVCYAVHRLDQMTGGVMVYAKTKAAAAALGQAFAAHAVQKEYLCVTEGCPTPERGQLCDVLFFDRAAGKSFPVRQKADGSYRRGAKPARLFYEVLQQADTPGGTRALLRVRLETGRTHQVRCQMAAQGTPLCGDGKYGGRDRGCRTALWAASLRFADPKTGKELSFCAPPPQSYPWELFDCIEKQSRGEP